jgi:catalase
MTGIRPQDLGGPERVMKVLGAMEHHMNGVPGYRRGHARGLGFHGTFTPTPEAAELTTAEHLQGERIECVVRLSNGGSSPYLADRVHAKLGNPLGFSVCFELASGGDSTWSALNLAAFMPRAADDFHEMVVAQRSKHPGGQPNPLRMLAFAARNPHAFRGLKAAGTLLPPKSYATERFNGMHAYWLIDPDGRRQAFRFHWLPVLGIQRFDPADEARLPPQYVLSELRERVAQGPVAWRLIFQLAADGDEVDDITKVWPDHRPTVDAGELVVDRLHDDQALVDDIVWDPTRMPHGIEPSNDPMLHFRSEAYWESHRRRVAETKPSIVPE